jgi:hypothetical protein
LRSKPTPPRSARWSAPSSRGTSVDCPLAVVSIWGDDE